MIAAESDDPRVVLSILRKRDKRFARHRVVSESRVWRAMEQILVPFLDLVNSVRVVAEHPLEWFSR